MQAFVLSAILLTVVLFHTCLKSEGETESQSELTLGETTAIDTLAVKSMVTPIADAAPIQPITEHTEASFLEVTRTAIDRQCGKCHHSNRSTNEVALSIFNLTNECWYCTLTEEQIPGLESRTMDSEDFTDEEKEALRRVVEEVERGG